MNMTRWQPKGNILRRWQGSIMAAFHHYPHPLAIEMLIALADRGELSSPQWQQLQAQAHTPAMALISLPVILFYHRDQDLLTQQLELNHEAHQDLVVWIKVLGGLLTETLNPISLSQQLDLDSSGSIQATNHQPTIPGITLGLDYLCKYEPNFKIAIEISRPQGPLTMALVAAIVGADQGLLNLPWNYYDQNLQWLETINRCYQWWAGVKNPVNTSNLPIIHPPRSLGFKLDARTKEKLFPQD
jgi:hypothetical protein